MVSNQAPAIYRKMDVHFGDDLAGDTEGVAVMGGDTKAPTQDTGGRSLDIVLSLLM